MTINEVKILSESIEVKYSSAEGDRIVQGSKRVNVGPTAKMNAMLQDLTKHLIIAFYYDDMDDDWKKSKIVATGFKYKYSESSEGAAITGKICLPSGRWIGISTDTIGFDDNAYGITDLEDAVSILRKLCKQFLFPPGGNEQLEIEDE